MAVTAATVAEWGKFDPPAAPDDVLLDRVLAAVTDHITEHYYTADPFHERQEQALLIQTARLWKRRDTPEGVIDFSDLGVVRVSRVDPDVELLLTRKVCFG